LFDFPRFERFRPVFRIKEGFGNLSSDCPVLIRSFGDFFPSYRPRRSQSVPRRNWSVLKSRDTEDIEVIQVIVQRLHFAEEIHCSTCPITGSTTLSITNLLFQRIRPFKHLKQIDSKPRQNSPHKTSNFQRV
jgi:hypothetical protein